jgi:hypothetical protein
MKNDDSLKEEDIGQGSIPLQLAFNDQPAEFVVELMCKGVLSGLLKGTIHLVYT